MIIIQLLLLSMLLTSMFLVHIITQRSTMFSIAILEGSGISPHCIMSGSFDHSQPWTIRFCFGVGLRRQGKIQLPKAGCGFDVHFFGL